MRKALPSPRHSPLPYPRATYPPFHSTLHSTRPKALPRTPLYGLYVSPLSLSWSTLSALSSVLGGRAKEICAARAGRGCASALANVPCSNAVRPEAVGGSDQRSRRRAGTYVHSPPPVAALHVAPDAPAPRYNSTATLSSAAARGENVSSKEPSRMIWFCQVG
jgi:hypothetical protein